MIAVTSGPGLEPALWVGITFAEELGKKWSKPVVPVNHMEGHIWSVLFPDQTKNHSNVLENLRMILPAIALLVSGGHTELVYIKDFGEYKILGRTRDDAVGEAFDKVARMLGLPYPGGPQISKLAEIHRSKNQESGIKFPRPMINSGDLDFSYSGLKTAVLYKLKENPEIDKEEMARAFEDASVEVLVEKTRKAITESEDEIKTLIVGGGVSANNHLKRELEKLCAELPGVTLKMPSRALSTDNALMIGLAAYIKVKKNPEILDPPAGGQAPIKAEGNLSLSC